MGTAMHKNILYFVLCLLAVLCGCSKEPDLPVSAAYDTFHATIGADTRAFFADAGAVKWNDDDAVSIYSDQVRPSVFQRNAQEGVFRGATVTGSVFYAYYPSDATYNKDQPTVVKFKRPEAVFDAGRMNLPMVAVSSTNQLTFKQTCGVLHFRIEGDGSYDKVTLQANGGETISGICSVDLSQEEPYLFFSGLMGSASMAASLPASASWSSGVDVYFPLPVVTLEQGFTLSFSGPSVETVSQATSKKVEIQRGKMLLYKVNLNELDGYNPSSDVIAPEKIDLGLPSGLLWGSFDLGATQPAGLSYHYSWGETEPKGLYNWPNYKWCSGSATTLTKYNHLASYGQVDNLHCLSRNDDAATVKLGDKWRIPSAEEWAELLDPANCTWETANQNGAAGVKVTSKVNGNSIFFRWNGIYEGNTLMNQNAAGSWWSDTLNDENPSDAWFMHSGNENVSFGTGRQLGRTVRPVYGDRVKYVQSVTVDPDELTLDAGTSATLEAAVTPADATNPSVTWSTSDATVASVSSTGEVTALKKGSAVITVTTVDGRKTATCSVTVNESYPVAQTVDLGLPSGTLWAAFNLGATAPEEPGLSFAWGETEPKEDYSWATYSFGSPATALTKYVMYGSAVSPVDHKGILDMEDDAAYARWGGDWRIPTRSELAELKEQCDWTLTQKNGVAGYEVASRTNENSIFMPMDGEYADPCYMGCELYTDERIYGLGATPYRYEGCCIRPVCKQRILPTDIQVVSTSVVVYLSEDLYYLNPTVYPAGSSSKTVYYISDNTAVATVTPEGAVTFLSKGMATIRMETVNGLTAFCTFTVKQQ